MPGDSGHCSGGSKFSNFCVLLLYLNRGDGPKSCMHKYLLLQINLCPAYVSVFCLGHVACIFFPLPGVAPCRLNVVFVWCVGGVKCHLLTLKKKAFTTLCLTYHLPKFCQNRATSIFQLVRATSMGPRFCLQKSKLSDRDEILGYDMWHQE